MTSTRFNLHGNVVMFRSEMKRKEDIVSEVNKTQIDALIVFYGSK